MCNRNYVASYLRSATGNLGDIQKQRKIIEKEIGRFGFLNPNICIYIDVVQSGMAKGLQFVQLKKDIANGRIDTVIVSRLNRVSRSPQHISQFFQLVQKQKIRFLSVNENVDSRFWNFGGTV